MVFFIGSEVMLFGAFFTAYFFIRYNVADTWPPLNQDGEPFELPKVITGSTRRSSWRRASRSTGPSTGCKHYNDRKGLQRGLIVTILLGATFLIIQINEYIHLGFTPQDTAFGSTFYTSRAHTGCTSSWASRSSPSACQGDRARDFSPGDVHAARRRKPLLALRNVVWVILYFLVYLL